MNPVELHRIVVAKLKELEMLMPGLKLHLLAAHPTENAHLLFTESHIPEIIDKLRELALTKRTLAREDIS